VKRIQRQRTKGWRMPPNTVYVGRPSRWGNPFVVGVNYLTSPRLTPIRVPTWRDPGDYDYDIHVDRLADRDMAVRWFAEWVAGTEPAPFLVDPLRGKDLACWCPLDQPCHADVLLELAAA
jgi:hypothetical protein